MTKDWLEAAWIAREDKVYADIFGADTGGIYPLDREAFKPFGILDPDPRWLMHGVLKFPPTEKRPTWVYVTSGLSNAWSDEQPDPDNCSGLGCELVFETAEDVPWAMFHVRRLLAFQILLGWGIYEGRSQFAISDRIPLKRPVDSDQSQLTWILIAPASGYAEEFHLPTGHVQFLHLVAVTEAEAKFAENKGYERLLEKLAPVGYPVTDPRRASVI